MSGIVGLFQKQGEMASEEVVRSMLASIPERAPHGAYVVGKDQAVLGQAFFSTGSQEGGRIGEPAICNQSELLLVADARIDNREDLARTLAIPREQADR